MNKAKSWVFVAIGLMAVLTYFNLKESLNLGVNQTLPEKNESFRKEQIESISLVSQSKTRPLDSVEQENVLDILSSGLKLKTQSLPMQGKSAFSFDQLIIKKKDGKELTLKPQFVMDENIVFSIPEDQGYDYMIERSQGKLSNLLNSLAL